MCPILRIRDEEREKKTYQHNLKIYKYFDFPLTMDAENFEEFQDETEVANNEEEEIVTTTVEELLISCVMARPPLWDSRLSITERSKTIRDNLWLEVYEEFGRNPEYSVDVLIKKWRNLRDTYVRLKGEYTPSGSAAKKKKKWEYFELMTFLNDTIKYKATVTNILSPTSSPLVSPVPSLSNDYQKNPSSRQKQGEIPKMEVAVLEALGKINAPPVEKAINPICIRISEILNQMPQRSRTVLEIKLLQLAYDGSKDLL